MLENGITVQRATREFTVQGKTYAAGSFVVLTAQAFRPHVMDMFEPQDHPDNFPYPGAPPTPPYDNAGWTLAFQMGVEFDRILDGFTGPFEKISDWNIRPPAGIVPVVPNAPGYLISPSALDAFVAVNRLLAANETVVRRPDGLFLVEAKPSTIPLLQRVAADRGISFTAATGGAARAGTRLTRPRIGLWDQYGGSMDAGWARWILEQFEFQFDRVFAPQLDAGNLNEKYDTLIFVAGGIPGGAGGGGRGGGAGTGAAQTNIPAEYRDQIGNVTAERTMPQIKQFIEKGGTVVAIGTSAANLARYLNLPIENHLVENGQPLPRTKFYVPGSVLRAHVDTRSPIANGMREQTDIFFDNSAVFRLGPNVPQGVKPIAWFDTKTPLRSGWAWGQEYLDGGVIAVDATFGKGRVLLFGTPILQRAQPHGTFKFLFNAIYAKWLS